MRVGVIYALLAAASAGVLLLLPVLLLGVTMSLVASVMRGEVIAWVSSAGMTYVFVGLPALLGVLLLFIPLRAVRAAGRRLGTRRAIRWAGGVLVAWHAGVALLWAREAMSRSAAMERPEVWYAIAFAIAAVVTLVGVVLVERRALRAAIALASLLALAGFALVAVVVSVWGSAPRIPSGAQTVQIVATSSGVRLDPATVHAGDVYFVVEASDDLSEHAGFAFVSAGPARQCCDAGPLPLSDNAVDRLARGDYQGTSSEFGWGGYVRVTLLEGKYVFLVGGDQVGVPPQSMTVLEVLP